MPRNSLNPNGNTSTTLNFRSSPDKYSITSAAQHIVIDSLRRQAYGKSKGLKL